MVYVTTAFSLIDFVHGPYSLTNILLASRYFANNHVPTPGLKQLAELTVMNRPVRYLHRFVAKLGPSDTQLLLNNGARVNIRTIH